MAHSEFMIKKFLSFLSPFLLRGERGVLYYTTTYYIHRYLPSTKRKKSLLDSFWVSGKVSRKILPPPLLLVTRNCTLEQSSSSIAREEAGKKGGRDRGGGKLWHKQFVFVINVRTEEGIHFSQFLRVWGCLDFLSLLQYLLLPYTTTLLPASIILCPCAWAKWVSQSSKKLAWPTWDRDGLFGSRRMLSRPYFRFFSGIIQLHTRWWGDPLVWVSRTRSFRLASERLGRVVLSYKSLRKPIYPMAVSITRT